MAGLSSNRLYQRLFAFAGRDELSVVTGIDDHSRFCVIAKLAPRATARPVCDALLEGLSRHGVPEQILTDNGKVFTGKLGRKPANVAFDRICLNNGIRHLLTAPYSPTTTCKIERLHKTMRKEFFAGASFASIEQARAGLDRWVSYYNHHREHQGIGDVAPIRRFELAEKKAFDVVDGEVEIEQVPQERPRVVARRVDQAGRISILKHRYHVGRYLAGQQVAVESHDGLLHVTHNGVVIATHARRHLLEHDVKMDRGTAVSRPARPTTAGHPSRLAPCGPSLLIAWPPALGIPLRLRVWLADRVTAKGWPVARLRPLPLSQAWAGHRPSLQERKRGRRWSPERERNRRVLREGWLS